VEVVIFIALRKIEDMSDQDKERAVADEDIKN